MIQGHTTENISIGATSKDALIASTSKDLRSAKKALGAAKFDGGSFELLKISLFGEDVLGLLDLECDLKHNSCRDDMLMLHSNATYRFSMLGYAYSMFLEAKSGLLPPAAHTVIARNDLETSNLIQFRDAGSRDNEASVPKNTPQLQTDIRSLYRDYEINSIKVGQDLLKLGLCPEQLDALVTSAKTVDFIWTLSFLDIEKLAVVVDDESICWEVRSMAMQIRLVSSKFYPTRRTTVV